MLSTLYGYSKHCKIKGQLLLLHDNSYHIIGFNVQFSEAEFVLRDPESHEYHCSQLETDVNASKLYGINRNSCLNKLK